FSSSIADLQFSESNTNIVYATSGGHLYKSLNKGARWSKADQLDTQVAHKAIIINKADPEKVYVTTAGAGLYETTDGGKNLSKAENQNLPSQIEARSLLFAPDGEYALSFVAGQGVYRLNSGSSTWQLYSQNSEVGNSYKAIIHPLDDSYIYASTSLQDIYLS